MVFRKFLFSFSIIAPIFVFSADRLSRKISSDVSEKYVDEGYIYIKKDLFVRVHEILSPVRNGIEQTLGRYLNDMEFLVKVLVCSKPLSQDMLKIGYVWETPGKSGNWAAGHPLIGSFPEYLPLTMIEGNEKKSFDIILKNTMRVRLIRNQKIY